MRLTIEYCRKAIVAATNRDACQKAIVSDPSFYGKKEKFAYWRKIYPSRRSG
jgi:hypothetical protein